MEKLRQTFLTLGISDCSLESGSMRCDGNISLRRRGTTEFGTKTEMKNINSFKSLHDALEYEICRQAEVLEEGGIVYQETRHWEPSRRRTVVMRVKETADDYRLFPDPDLAPFDLTDEFIDRCRARIPELPDAKRDRYVADYGLKRADAASSPAIPRWPPSSRRPSRAWPRRTWARWPTSWSTSCRATTPSPWGRSAASPVFSPRTRSRLRRPARCSTRSRHRRGRRRPTWTAHGMRQSTDEGVLGAIVDEVLGRCTDPGPAVPRRQQEGARVPRGPVHEGGQGLRQPQGLQQDARREARGVARRTCLPQDPALGTACRKGRGKNSRRTLRGQVLLASRTSRGADIGPAADGFAP